MAINRLKEHMHKHKDAVVLLGTNATKDLYEHILATDNSNDMELKISPLVRPDLSGLVSEPERFVWVISVILIVLIIVFLLYINVSKNNYHNNSGNILVSDNY